MFRACLIGNVALSATIALTGCASNPPNPSMNYVRADGSPTNMARAQLVLAQCQATAGPVPWTAAMLSPPSRETTFINACMARNGYLAQ
jgi:hypothetical protein